MSAARERLLQAIAKHRAGDHAAAESGYRAHLRDFPEDASGLHFLGLLRSHQGRNQEAIPLMLAALERDPEYIDAWSNLGILYFEERDLVRSEKCCRRAIELAPQFANGWANLGMTLQAAERHEEALQAWDRALQLQPGLRNISIAYGQLLYRLNRMPQALDFYQRWQAAIPEDPIPQHMLAAMGGADRPGRASSGYVRATFDDFADSFDKSLERLQYRAPQLLSEAIIRSGALARMEALDILDMGCGTGLCGPLLKPLARGLVGVDLSPKMLSKAAARGLYDQLNCAELTEWLGACTQRFDLAIAADVLCYFGDLSAVFPRVYAVLAPGGCFAFSLEAPQPGAPSDASHPEVTQSNEPFILQPHGRYQHDRDYVRAMLSKAGLREVQLSEAVLRYERGEQVIGHLVVATRPVGS